MPQITLSDTQQTTLTLQPKNAAGHLTPVDGVPEWSVAPLHVARVTPAADGLTALLVGTGAGSAVVTASADADRTDGVRLIVGTLDVVVTASEATTLEIVAADPVGQV